MELREIAQLRRGFAATANRISRGRVRSDSEWIAATRS